MANGHSTCSCANRKANSLPWSLATGIRLRRMVMRRNPHHHKRHSRQRNLWSTDRRQAKPPLPRYRHIPNRCPSSSNNWAPSKAGKFFGRANFGRASSWIGKSPNSAMKITPAPTRNQGGKRKSTSHYRRSGRSTRSCGCSVAVSPFCSRPVTQLQQRCCKTTVPNCSAP